MGQAIDPSGEARSVLQSAVADYGDRVLSNAAILDGICEDRLPEWPREASLVSIAARADVAAMLQQQAGGVGPDAAVRLTAASLAESRSIDPAASIWVVGEFARALGYQVSDSLQPAGSAGSSAGAAGTPGAPPAPGTPPGEPGTSPAPGTPPAGSPPGDLTVPPSGGFPHPPTQQAGFGHHETVTTGPGAPAPGQGTPAPGQGTPQPGAGAGAHAGNAYGWTPPPAAAAPGGGAGPGGPPSGPPGGRPPGARPPRQGLVLGLGAAALLVVYLVIAGVGHLPPFGKAAAPTPSPTPTPTRPTPSATTFTPTAGDATLEALIPSDVSAGGSCSPVHRPAFGSTAEMHCAGAPDIPAGYVQYYLFASTADLGDAYATYLSDFAQARKNTGDCHRLSGTAAFRSFSSCETQFSIGSSSTARGRVTEYFYKGTPDISCTYEPKLVLVDMQGSGGNALLRWWDHSPNWIKANQG